MPGPWFVHEALPIRSPLKGTGPEVTLKVALTLAPGATESNVCDVPVVPGTKEVHCLPGTEMLSRTPTAGDAPVFVNVTVLSCEDPGANVYMLTNFSQGQSYTLTRFDSYWGQKAYFQTVKISVIPSIEEQILQLRAGHLDMILHGYPFDQLSSLPRREVYTYNDLGLEMGYINAAGPLKNTALRSGRCGPEPVRMGVRSVRNLGHAAISLFPKLMPQPASPLIYPASSGKRSGIPPVRYLHPGGGRRAAAGHRSAGRPPQAAGIQATPVRFRRRRSRAGTRTQPPRRPTSSSCRKIPTTPVRESMVGDFYVAARR